MSEVPVWTCEFAAPSEQAPLEHLTVGDRFRMSCRGDIAVAWGADVPRVTMPKPDQDFTLVILSAEKLDPHAVQLTVTGYRPGEHQPEYVRILQGDRGFEVEKPKWKIESVIQQDGSPPKPYPSEGFWGVRPPVWFIALVLMVPLVLVLLAIRWGRRWYKRHQFRAELRSHQTALPPVRQFYRDARLLRRRLNQAADQAALAAVVTDLNRDVRKLLLREFEVPALTDSDGVVIKAILKRPIARETSFPEPALRKVVRELSRAVKSTSLTSEDADQLLRMSVDLAEAIERSSR